MRWIQDTRFPAQEGTSLTVRTARPTAVRLRLRVPWWAGRGASARLNGKPLDGFAAPTSSSIGPGATAIGSTSRCR